MFPFSLYICFDYTAVVKVVGFILLLRYVGWEGGVKFGKSQNGSTRGVKLYVQEFCGHGHIEVFHVTLHD